MLVFIVALKSKQVSHSWERVEQLFENTLKSLCAQTCDRFQVVVVCHEKPAIAFKHQKVVYVSVPFPVPKGFEGRRSDKRRKHLTGLIHASQFNPTHTMYVDADDYVSQYLAEYVKENTACPGWFFREGYVYPNLGNFIYINRKDFHRWCGTSNIVRHDLRDIPKDTFDNEVDYDRLYVGHPDIQKHLRDFKGVHISALPFRGAIYNVGHGDNIRDFRKILFPDSPILRIKKTLSNYRFVTKKIRQEFNFLGSLA